MKKEKKHTTSLVTTATQTKADVLSEGVMNSICPQPDYKPDSEVDVLLSTCIGLDITKRADYVREDLEKGTKTFASHQIVRLLTEVRFADGFEKFLAALDPTIFRLSPEDLKTILLYYKDSRPIQLMILQSLRTCLSDTSDAAKATILSVFKCLKKPSVILENVQPRKCVIGKVTDNIVFVLDCSGSMEYTFSFQGKSYKRIEYAKMLLSSVVNDLKDGNLFNFILFNSGVKSWKTDLVPATAENRASALEWIANLRAISSTNIEGAAKMAMSYYNVADYSILYATDGYPTAGVTNPSQIIKNIRMYNDQRVAKGLKAIKLNVDVIDFGGIETAKEKQLARDMAIQIGQATGGVIKNFNI